VERRGDLGHKAASRSYFDSVAGRYETDWRWRWVRRQQSLTLDALELRSEDSLLDVGCGTGSAVRSAAPLVARAVGIDLAPKMIERAGELAQGLENVELLVGDSQHLPFAEEEFTAVLCTSSLHHCPNPEGAVLEMARVLAPGGRLAVGDSDPGQLFVRLLDRHLKLHEPGHLGFLRAEAIARLLSEAGLGQVDLRRLHRPRFVIALGRKP
jgi:ubiquinone/menaquinone biosynthesis C-methylase UbiE